MHVGKDELTLSDYEIQNLAGQLCSAGFHGDLSFQSRANRDAVAALCKRMGAKLKKSSIANQIVDPRYTVEGSHLPDKGLANTTIWTNLYILQRWL